LDGSAVPAAAEQGPEAAPRVIEGNLTRDLTVKAHRDRTKRKAKIGELPNPEIRETF
jgi:hypothetical protein